MKITLNVHSRLAKFYILFYDRSYLPNNLCSYFWLLLFAFICTPLCYPAMLANYLISPPYYRHDTQSYSNGGNVPTGVGVVLSFVIFILGFFLTLQFYGDSYGHFLPLWKAYVNGIIYTITLCIGILLLVNLIKFIIKIYPKRVRKEERELSYEERMKLYEEAEELERQRRLRRQERRHKSFWYILGRYFIAWKDKNCPIIEWKTKK